MRTVEYKEYIIELPGGAELRLNEEAWNAVQYLIKQAKGEALLEAAEELRRRQGGSASYCDEYLEKKAKELE